MRFTGIAILLAVCSCFSCRDTTPPTTAGLPANAVGRIVFDGNSLLATEYGEPAWPDLVIQALAAPKVSSANIGVGGQTTADMLRDVDTQTQPLFATGEPDIYIAWEVTNDLFFGASADSAYARIVRLGRDQRAKGWRVIVMTPMPRGNASHPEDWEARRQSVLLRMRANWRSFADELVDIAADPVLGSYASLDDKRYFRDRVHLGPDGTKLVAQLVTPAVERQLMRQR